MHPGEKYDVMFIGNILHNSSDSRILELLGKHYVFLFTTRLNQDKGSPTYGHVNIDLVRYDDLPHFEPHFREFPNFHTLENNSLRINDFLEVISRETENGQLLSNLTFMPLVPII